MVYIPIDIDSAFKKECRRRYSEKTIKSYLYWVHRFLNSKFCRDKELGKISKKDVRLFLEYLSDRNLSGNTLNQAHMALKFLFEDVLYRKMWIDIKYSKTPKKIQRVLTKQEISKLIISIKNKSHNLMVSLMYGSGLRVSELINLKIGDLCLDKNYGFIRKGKGNKDRIFVIPLNLLLSLRKHIGIKKLAIWGKRIIYL
jgi:site-specific recombinase XerD